MEDELQIDAIRLMHKIIPEVEMIITVYKANPNDGFSAYVTLIKSIQTSMKTIVNRLKNPSSIGYISPRLLRDPLSTKLVTHGGSSEEIEAHIVGYLKAILQLIYCVAKGLEGWQFSGTMLYKAGLESRTLSINNLPPLITLLKQEMRVIEAKLPDKTKKTLRNVRSSTVASYTEVKEKEIITNSDTTNVPFTARLMAYYRAIERNRTDPLIDDPFALRLAGDLKAYFKKHGRYSENDYPIVRSYYIESQILTPWCKTHQTSQIVLLGSGLDTRAYRFHPFEQGVHRVFEIDFPYINHYKGRILQDAQPLCDLTRISTDLSNPQWASQLKKSGFSADIPTLWILEGLIYYLKQETASFLLKQLASMCPKGSQIFLDICVPTLAHVKVGPFMKYFKWGLNKEDVPSFFKSVGWQVTCSFADEHDQGRDVGQRGLIFVQGVCNTPD